MYLEKIQEMFPPIYSNINKFCWKSLDINYPYDYKQLVNCYGAFGIDEFLWIINPFSQNDLFNQKKAAELEEAYKISKHQLSEVFKFDIFRENKGLIALGGTENGDELFWLVNNSHWSIIVYQTRSNIYYKYDMELSEFLYKLIKKEILCPCFPVDFPSENINLESLDNYKNY